MERVIYIDHFQGAMRRVVVEDGIPVEVALDVGSTKDSVGSIVIGRVEKVMLNIGAVFVNIGMEKNGFLPLTEMIDCDATDISAAGKRSPLATGRELIVQVTKSASGDKGARLTMNATYPGKYCVLLVAAQTVGVSRHIEDTERRLHLESIAKSAQPDGMGLLIRTSAADAREEWITDEARRLHAEWNQVISRAKAQKAPAMLFNAGNLLDSAMRDLHGDIYQQPLPPSKTEKLRKALRRKIWLPSGAYLVIDHTEAMTVIDVNSGKCTTKGEFSQTMRNLNLEAAKESARQIRLRDIGGIIVIDLIDMRDDADRKAVLEAFVEATRGDRAKLHIHGFSPAGMLELTRRSVYKPFMQCRCTRCLGTGVEPDGDREPEPVSI